MSTHRLSLNTATTKYWTLEEAVDGVVAAGIESVGLWRDRVAEAGLERAAQLVRERGLRVSSLCRGGFLTASDADGVRVAREDHRAAIGEAAPLGTRARLMGVGVRGGLAGHPGGDLGRGRAAGAPRPLAPPHGRRRQEPRRGPPACRRPDRRARRVRPGA